MKSSSTDIIIIGAGIAGLAAGCYAQMNGYRTQIFEMHNLPGGLCTAWKRKGYVFDGCIHYLFGSGKNQPFYQMWEELGAVQGRQFVHHDEFMRIVAPDGKTLIVYSDPDRLERHMLSLSPSDKRLIKEFCAGIWDFTDFDMSLLQQKPKVLMNPVDWVRLSWKMLPFVGLLNKWGKISASEFGNHFQDPFLRCAIPQMFAWKDIPMMVGMSLLAYTFNKNAGFPVGASLEFARAIEKRYLDNGGEIHYCSQVERVLVENDQAVGVRLYSNEEYYADRIISACDGRGTIFDLLGGKYLNRQIKKLYDGHLPLHSQLQVSLGLNRDLSSKPHWVTYLLEQPIVIAGEERYEIGVKHYCFDPSLAPAGKSVVIVMLNTPYDYWQRIYGRSIYDAEQIQESHILINQLEKFYPDIKADIEFIDVATPLSYERYTGNWQGSNCGWLLTKKTMFQMVAGIDKTLPGLDNFYMIGQWVEPGGSVPVVAMSGRNIIQQICHEDKKVFITTTLDSKIVKSKAI
ncbi:amine oxidase [Dulcicalothrix desertica PCC 7102]|uniref:Amine oxidase n=1 Tax=Dulcicalothrix desertica PCC 7102 TaxID=232991 RepID=A0A3S1C7H0_9CYAN|nr:NAD(P)/FAD-dependent oxidoreductase [Dulcicalothrix desertica]RUT01741.1 amine oxidase [Dulcicalothrix desertica PCC 7102]TWH42892.1 phytoene dehydrogenase-like protein [Dulcicalothrix desertica PCC 7102]